MRARPPMLLVVAGVLACLAGAARADQMRAAEKFALAQSKEKRGDYAGAIEAYLEAYAISPHASVLYNVAVNHERLEDYREAARFFLRYVNEAGSPDDADEVLARVAELRQRPSRVTFEVRPPQAVLFVGGVERGAGSQTLTLDAGTHRVHIADGDRRSPPSQVICEFGDELTVVLDLDARPGLLRVDSNVEGAEVRVGGNVVGHTPFSGQIPAGTHLVVVTMDGYQAGQRQITVQAQGSEQIRIDLVRVEGEEPESPEELRARGMLFAVSYGYSGQSGYRSSLTLGYRPVDRFEVSVGYGAYGELLGTGVQAEARFYVTTGNLRPYARGGVIFGNAFNDSEGTLGFEGGAGILWTSAATRRARARQTQRTGPAFHVEYFLEASVLFTEDEDDGGIVVGDPTSGAPTLRPGLTLSLPIVVGFVLRFG